MDACVPSAPALLAHASDVPAFAAGDLVGTRDLVYNLCENNQLTDRHIRLAVYPFVKQGRRNAQLCSQFFPPDEFYHLTEK